MAFRFQRATLCSLAEVEQKNAKFDPQNVTAVETLLRGFFSFAPEKSVEYL